MLNAIGAYCKEPLPVPTSTAMLLQEQITLWFQHLAVVQQQFIEGTHQLESKLKSKSTMVSATTTATSGTNPSDQDILASIPGVGTIVLARLLGEAGTATTPPCGVSLESPRALIARGSLVGCTQHLRAANSRPCTVSINALTSVAQVDPICQQRYEALKTCDHTHDRAFRSKGMDYPLLGSARNIITEPLIREWSRTLL